MANTIATRNITLTLILKTLQWVILHSRKGWCRENRHWVPATDEWVADYTDGMTVRVTLDANPEHPMDVYFITVEAFDRICTFTWYESARTKKIEKRAAKVLGEISYKEISIPCASIKEAEEKWNMELTPFRC